MSVVETIPTLVDYKVYDDAVGHRASNIPLLEWDPREYRDKVMPSPYLKAIMPREGSGVALQRGSVVDERVFRREKQWRFTSLNKNSKAFKEMDIDDSIVWVGERSVFGSEATRIYKNQIIGMCRNVMALLRSEFGADWREPPALVQYMLTWHEHIDGCHIPMKMLGDYYNGYSIDLKCTSYPTDPARAAYNFGYDLKDAHYSAGLRSAGLNTDESFLLYVSTSYPYRAKLWEFPEWMRDKAEERYREICLRNLARGLGDGDWSKTAGMQIEERMRHEAQPYWHKALHGEWLGGIDTTGVEEVDDGEI